MKKCIKCENKATVEYKNGAASLYYCYGHDPLPHLDDEENIGNTLDVVKELVAKNKKLTI